MELFNQQLKFGSGFSGREVQIRMVDTDKGDELSLGEPEEEKRKS